jgi:hypothetical protein
MIPHMNVWFIMCVFFLHSSSDARFSQGRSRFSQNAIPLGLNLPVDPEDGPKPTIYKPIRSAQCGKCTNLYNELKAYPRMPKKQREGKDFQVLAKSQTKFIS